MIRARLKGKRTWLYYGKGGFEADDNVGRMKQFDDPFMADGVCRSLQSVNDWNRGEGHCKVEVVSTERVLRGRSGK